MSFRLPILDLSGIQCHNSNVVTKHLIPPIHRTLLGALVTLLSLFPVVSFSLAETDLKIPADYGEVIYQCNAKSPNQLFIIGLNHRDSLTRLNGAKTPRVQAEVYKIGDWLIHQEGCELLLPEGFFKTRTAGVAKAKGPAKPVMDDMTSLEQRLADNRVFVNAEMLLKEHHPLRLQQVEDKALYDAVGAGIFKLVNGSDSSSDYLSLKSELDYLQERRTAAMLQKIPEIVDLEFKQGSIKNRKAIFTIGLSHLHKIISYLSQSRIAVYSPLLTSDKSGDYVAKLDLFKADFGVSVIIPRTLANDRKVLELNKLDKPMPKYPGQFSGHVITSSLPE
jgi:hypothetical protein